MILKLKKGLFLGTAVALVATAGVGLTACGDNPSSATIDAQDFYAMAAISSVNYLQSNALATQSALNNASTFTDTSTGDTSATSRPSSVSDEDVNNLASYMGMFRDMLASDTTEYFTNTTVAETDEYYGEYNLKMTLSIPQINGGQEQFVMYYKEIDTKTEQELDDDEVELEVDTKLQGIIVYGGSTFDVVGEREYEQEGNETEVSIEFTTRSRANSQNYITIEHEKENNEIEYSYSIYQNGRLANETEVEFENERNEKSLELEFVNNSASGQDKVKYEITQNRNDENKCNVRVKSVSNENNIRENFIITITDTGYTFTYSNGFSENV